MLRSLEIFVIFSLICGTFGFKSRDEEQKFVADLLNKTTLSSVPRKDLAVIFSVALYQLMEINEKHGTATMRIWLMVAYHLPEIQWNPLDVDGVDLIYLPPDSVWIPDILLFDVSEIKYEAFENQLIQSDGLVHAKNSMTTFKVTCKLNFRYFPFDQQDCPLTAGQWIAHSGNYMIDGIDGPSGQIPYESAEISGEWELNLPITYSVQDMDNWDGYHVIKFNFRFKRNPEFYLIVLVVPSVLLGILPTLAFLIPVESGEKISLGLTTLLAQVVELLVLSDILPPSSRGGFPIFGRLVIYSVVLIVISIFESIIVTCVYNISPGIAMNSKLVSLLNSRIFKFACLSKMNDLNRSAGKFSNSNGNRTHADNRRVDDISAHEPIFETHNWQLLSQLIDRLMFIVYFILLISGLTYFIIAIKI